MAYGVKVTGCTVHVATLEVDSGPILAQVAVPVEPDDTAETLWDFPPNGTSVASSLIQASSSYVPFGLPVMT